MTAPQRGAEDPHELTADRQAETAARAAAEQFVNAWLLHGHPADRYRALSPVTSPVLLQTLADLDQRDLPAGTLIAPPIVTGSGPYQIAFRASLSDGATIEVVMVDDGAGGWRAAEIRPAE